MNKKENLKVAVIESCVNGTMTIKVAAKRLGFSGKNIGRILNYLLDIVHSLPEKNLHDTLICKADKCIRKEKNQSYDRRSRNISLPYVIKSST